MKLIYLLGGEIGMPRKIRCNHCLKAMSVSCEVCPFCGGDQSPVNPIGESKHEIYEWKDSKVLRELYIEVQQGNKSLKDIRQILFILALFIILFGGVGFVVIN